MPDRLLVGWWLLFASTAIAFLVFRRWDRNADRKTATLAFLRGEYSDAYRPFASRRPLPLRILRFPIAVSIFLLLGGGWALVWMSTWTAPLYIHMELWMILFGALFLSIALAAAPLRIRRIPIPDTFAKPIFFVFGLLCVGGGLRMAIGDTVYPRLVVEGQVERVARLAGLREFFIVIDGTRSYATRQTYLLAKPGERVKAELGAGSKMIFQIEPVRAAKQAGSSPDY